MKKEMKRQNLVIIGGGSTYTPGMIMALIAEKVNFPLKKITFFDIDGERQEKIAKGCEVILKEHYPELESFNYTTDKETAYTEGDFFFVQIRTGGLQMRHLDERIPLENGCVGQETCGAGGMAYALRSIPDMIQIVNDIRKYSNGWILNYTNPAAIVAIALQKEFPDDKKIINVCDMPAVIMNSYASILGVDLWDIDVDYFGLNHFGWFTSVRDQFGVDHTNLIKNTILEEGIKINERNLGEDKSWVNTFNQVKVTLGDFPEYLPNTYLQYYLYPEKMVAKEDVDNTRAIQVINSREKEEFGLMKKIAKSQTTKGEEIEADIHGQYMVRIAASIAYNKQEKYIIITKNNGAIANLADDVMVEVPSLLTSSGVMPLAVGNIETFYKGMIENQNAFEQLVVEAFYEKSYNKLLQALTLNRTVGDAPKARIILDKLIEANKKYWPEFN